MKKQGTKGEKELAEIMSEPESEIVRVITEIHERGGQILEAFQDIDDTEMSVLLPALRAIRDSQDATLDALKEIQKMEVVHAEA